MAIKCGRNPNHLHDDIDEYRRCLNGELARETAAVTTAPQRTTSAESPATDKQISFLCSLAIQKLAKSEADSVTRDAQSGRWTRRSISAEIDRLKEMPRRPTPAVAPDRSPAGIPVDGQEKPATAQTRAELEAGMYRRDGIIYKVQLAVHGSGKPYAKRLVATNECQECKYPASYHDVADDMYYKGCSDHDFKAKWAFEYASGAIWDLQPGHKLSLEEAKEFGALYGTCCCCGRTLTNEESIKKRIGPICEGKYFG